MVDCIDDFASALAMTRCTTKVGGWDLTTMAWKGISSLASVVVKVRVPQLPRVPETTKMEKVLIGGIACYGCYKLYNKGVIRLPTKTAWNDFKLWMGYSPNVVVRENTHAEQSRQFECLRPYSEEIELEAPKSQCMIGGMIDGDFVVNGNAVLMGNELTWFLVMPEHVWISGENVWAKGRQSQVNLSYKRATDDVVNLAIDLLAVRITAKEMSIIGISRIGVLSYLQDFGAEAKLVGCQGLGTMGLLKHDKRVFGRVVYDGSTKGGYSGAAYIVNNQIAGIHTYGSKSSNGGWNGGFIWMVLSHYIRNELGMNKAEEPEETPEWLERAAKGKKKIRVDRQWGDLDEVRIQVDGKYAVVNRKSMRTVFGRDWEDSMDALGEFEAANKMGYQDREQGESLSGEYPSSNVPGGLSCSKEAQELVERAVQKSMSACFELSKKQFADARRLQLSQDQGSCTQGNRLDTLSPSTSH